MLLHHTTGNVQGEIAYSTEEGGTAHLQQQADICASATWCDVKLTGDHHPIHHYLIVDRLGTVFVVECLRLLPTRLVAQPIGRCLRNGVGVMWDMGGVNDLHRGHKNLGQVSPAPDVRLLEESDGFDFDQNTLRQLGHLDGAAGRGNVTGHE